MQRRVPVLSVYIYTRINVALITQHNIVVVADNVRAGKEPTNTRFTMKSVERELKNARWAQPVYRNIWHYPNVSHSFVEEDNKANCVN